MPFQVRARLVAFLGDIDKYPCHFCHEVGDEIIFDGEKYIGRLCPDVWPMLTAKAAALHAAGPRYVEPGFYYPFWYCSVSTPDPSQKKYDGLGFKNVLETIEPPPHDMAHLIPPNAFKWPPHPELDVAKGIGIFCPDLRSAAAFILEAFDLSEKGFDIPYFRREMAVLDKVSKKQGIETNKILNEFSNNEIEEIYPPLSQQMMVRLVEELELMNYLEIKNSAATVTKKGKSKLEDYEASLTDEEREALKI
jgi:hypothetical protein